MLNLLAKDFKLIFASETDNKRKIVSTIFAVLVFIAFIAIETFIFNTILNKIKTYNEAPIAFMTLFLFIISILMIFNGVFQAKKLFFNEKDIDTLTAYPVSNGQIVASKLVFLLITQVATSFMFTYPLFVSYGAIMNKMRIFYYIALFYPLLSFVFEIGIVLLFVYPFKLLTDFLKKHLIVQFIVALVLMFGLCYLYGNVLTIFINLVASNNIQAIFSVSFIEKLNKAKNFFIPTDFIVSFMIKNDGKSFLPYLLISIGVFILGLSIAVYAFNYFIKINIINNPTVKKEHDLKVISPVKALIKKELILLFKDSNYIFSFSGLLMVQPFLIYLVIYALNTIFTSGSFAYIISVLPNFIPMLDMVLIMLFTLTINQGANQYIGMENKNIRLMKTIPVSSYVQLFIKVLIPLLASVASLLVSLLVLLIAGVISFNTFIFSFILITILLVIFDIVSLFEELKIRRNKPRSTSMSTLYSYLLPIVYFVATMILSYFKISIYLVYLVGFVVFVLLGLPFVINFKKKINTMFMELEVVN